MASLAQFAGGTPTKAGNVKEYLIILSINKQKMEDKTNFTMLISALIAIVSGAVTAYVTTIFKIKEEERKWKKDLALKYAEIKINDPLKYQKFISQFGIGVLILKSLTNTEGGTEKYFIAPSNRFLIGRSVECDIVIQDSKVSRKHFSIRADTNTVWVEMLGATNPVILNGKQMINKMPLNDGDIIQIGDSQMQFKSLT